MSKIKIDYSSVVPVTDADVNDHVQAVNSVTAGNVTPHPVITKDGKGKPISVEIFLPEMSKAALNAAKNGVGSLNDNRVTKLLAFPYETTQTFDDIVEGQSYTSPHEVVSGTEKLILYSAAGVDSIGLVGAVVADNESYGGTGPAIAIARITPINSTMAQNYGALAFKTLDNGLSWVNAYSLSAHVSVPTLAGSTLGDVYSDARIYLGEGQGYGSIRASLDEFGDNNFRWCPQNQVIGAIDLGIDSSTSGITFKYDVTSDGVASLRIGADFSTLVWSINKGFAPDVYEINMGMTLTDRHSTLTDITQRPFYIDNVEFKVISGN